MLAVNYTNLRDNMKAYMDKVLANGAERAYYVARKTLSKVYKKIGLVPLSRG